MKKNILIVLLALITLLFIVYAFIQADEAEKAKTEAMQLKDKLQSIERCDDSEEMAHLKAKNQSLQQLSLKLTQQIDSLEEITQTK